MDIDTNPAPRPRLLPAWLTVRRAIGLGIVLCGMWLLLGQAARYVAALDMQLRYALLGGLAAAGATALGTLPVLVARPFSKRSYDSFLGFGAGVMLGATAFSLVLPALASARDAGASNWHASLVVAGGIVVGAAAILLLGRVVRAGHTHESGELALSQRRAWLFVWAVALHNLPEGLAIGVAFAGIDPDKAVSLATGISIQDIPEGLVVALALHAVGYSRAQAVGMGMLSGLAEPIAAVFGVIVIGLAQPLLPYALAAAAGAMLLVIVNDVIPESRQSGNGTWASSALVLGFVVMTVLDTALS